MSMSKVLGPGANELSNGHDDPGDLVLGEAELVGERVGEGALEALAVGRVAELPRVGRWPSAFAAKYGG